MFHLIRAIYLVQSQLSSLGWMHLGRVFTGLAWQHSLACNHLMAQSQIHVGCLVSAVGCRISVLIQMASPAG